MKISRYFGRYSGLLIITALIACGAGKPAGDSPPQSGSADNQSESRTVAQAANLAAEGELAPDFTLSKIDGGEVTLSELRGKVVILDFWATWCPPCVKGIPEFVELYNEYKAQGLDVIGLSLDRGPSPVKKFVVKNNVNYPVVMADRKVSDAYRPAYIPTTYIIDREGKIVSKVVGYNPKSFFVSEIKGLL
jgi:peroxiredoxin